MKNNIVYRRVVGSLLLYVLTLISIVFGYLLSSDFSSPVSLGTVTFLGDILWVMTRILAFIFGVFLLYKVFRPFSKGLFLAYNPGENILFDGIEKIHMKTKIKILLLHSLACFLIGFGAFGAVPLLFLIARL